MYEYRADDLEEDEVNYELSLRGLPVVGTVAQKRRCLRNVLSEDRKINPVYKTSISLESSLPFINQKIKAIAEELEFRVTSKGRSRIISLINRINRAPTSDITLRANLEQQVTKLYYKFYNTTSVAQQDCETGNFGEENVALETQGIETVQIDFSRPPPPITPHRDSSNTHINTHSPTLSHKGIETQQMHTSQDMNQTQNNNHSFDPWDLLTFSPLQEQMDKVQSPNQRSDLGATQQHSNKSTNVIGTTPTLTQQVSDVQPNLQNFQNLNLDTSNLTGTRPRTNVTNGQPENLLAGSLAFPLEEDNGMANGVISNVHNANRGELPTEFRPEWLNHLQGFIKETIRESVRAYIDEWSALSTPQRANTTSTPNINPTFREVGVNTVLPDQTSTHSCETPRSHAPFQSRAQTQTSFQPSHSQYQAFQPRQPYFHQQPQQQSQAHQYMPNPSHYYHHLRTKIEKWGIQFNGEIGPRTLTASEFIRQVTILARANRVSEDELLQQAYMFFVGEARKWYFTYCEDFRNWQELVHQLMINFENPNKDRAIEDEMRERKQKSNERFSIYLSDMERLSKSLSYKMNEGRKLKMIFDNTKISYRRRLALTPITSVQSLAEYCFYFDSLEPNLYTNLAPKPHGVHQIECEEGDNSTTDEETEVVNAIGGQKFRFKGKAKKPDFKSSGQSANITESSSSEQNLENLGIPIKCWNCSSSGHIGKNCPEPRRVYCYACGEPNFTTKNCPKQHPEKEESKN